MIFVGDDWAEAHHDVYVCDEAGVKLARDDCPRASTEWPSSMTLSPPMPAILATWWSGSKLIEGCGCTRSSRPATSCTRSTRKQRRGIGIGTRCRVRSPIRVTRRCSPSSCAQIATTTARSPATRALAEGIKILARAHQSLVWERTRATNRLRSSLREYFPAALDTFAELADRDTLAVLASGGDAERSRQADAGQDPHRVAPRRPATQHRDPRRHHRSRVCAATRLRAPAAVEAAHGATTRSSVAILAALNTQIDALAGELADHFEQHPDSDFYLSLPGVGVVLGARALGEFGDDPNRYADAKSRKNYAGTSPITRASGTQIGRACPLRSQPPSR